MFPLIVFTGANAPTTVDLFPRGKAVHYAERAAELGVPRDAILTETRARNTGENFTLTKDLLHDKGIDAHSATIISRPYQQRRAYASARKLWPDLNVTCSARTQSSPNIASIGDADRMPNMLVGDTQRIWVYADAGYAEPQAISNDTMDAYRRLVDAGYTRRLIDRAST